MSSRPDAHEDEREILAGLRRGDRSAATVVVERLTPVISRMVFRLTGWHTETEDLIQDVFLAIQQSAGSFRGDCRLETWATSITVNCCRRWQRRRRTRQFVTNDKQPDPVDDSFYEVQDTGELREEVQLALRELKHELRELVVLRYLEGYSLDDMSQLLNVRKNTLEVRLLRARKQLGDLLTARAVTNRRSNHD